MIYNHAVGPRRRDRPNCYLPVPAIRFDGVDRLGDDGEGRPFGEQANVGRLWGDDERPVGPSMDRFDRPREFEAGVAGRPS